MHRWPWEPLDVRLTAQLCDFAVQCSDWKIALSLFFWGKKKTKINHNKIYYYFTCIGVLPVLYFTCICVCVPCVSSALQRSKKVESPGTGIMGGYKLIWVLWKGSFLLSCFSSTL